MWIQIHGCVSHVHVYRSTAPFMRRYFAQRPSTVCAFMSCFNPVKLSLSCVTLSRPCSFFPRCREALLDQAYATQLYNTLFFLARARAVCANISGIICGLLGSRTTLLQHAAYNQWASASAPTVETRFVHGYTIYT
ncbi:TPA: hypothetical protein ACH3X2_013940 [Trebouxia sp. C0005]